VVGPEVSTRGGLSAEAARRASERFSAALRALWEEAGRPTYSALSRRAVGYPVSLSRSSLSDWMTGRSVPAEPSVVQFLVEELLELADRRNQTSRRVPAAIDAWMNLHREVVQERARRAGRPLHRRDLPAGPKRDLRDFLYGLYIQADTPSLRKIENLIKYELSDRLLGGTERETISGTLSGAVTPSLTDALSIATALTQIRGVDPRYVVEDVRRLWAATFDVDLPAPPRTPRGLKRIRQCNPLALQVHKALALPDDATERPELSDLLPTYVVREHDARLRQIVNEVEAGASRLAVLVGGASTGKTRACWEAVQQLPDHWRLWHPIDPTPALAAAEGVGEVRPSTVVWLDEAQEYLAPSDADLGERVVAGLRTLLEDQDRGPVLILATIWPTHLQGLMAAETSTQARALLATAAIIHLPDQLTKRDLAELRTADDPRLRHAAKHADAGRLTQYLAGTPELLRRYEMAPPPARAVMNVAIDVHRHGFPTPIPHALFEQAVPGYLPDSVWDQLDDRWLDEALAYTMAPAHGLPGALVRVRPRPGDDGAQLAYRLADYLEQIGRKSREGIVPPESFWAAVAGTAAGQIAPPRFGQCPEVVRGASSFQEAPPGEFVANGDDTTAVLRMTGHEPHLRGVPRCHHIEAFLVALREGANHERGDVEQLACATLCLICFGRAVGDLDREKYPDCQDLGSQLSRYLSLADVHASPGGNPIGSGGGRDH
jgi:hypothetical protein